MRFYFIDEKAKKKIRVYFSHIMSRMIGIQLKSNKKKGKLECFFLCNSIVIHSNEDNPMDCSIENIQMLFEKLDYDHQYHVVRHNSAAEDNSLNLNDDVDYYYYCYYSNHLIDNKYLDNLDWSCDVVHKNVVSSFLMLNYYCVNQNVCLFFYSNQNNMIQLTNRMAL